MIRAFVIAILSVGFANAASVGGFESAQDAYRSGDIQRAYVLAQEPARQGSIDAQKLMAKIILSPANHEERFGERAVAIEYLKAAAREGNYIALISLENERRKGGDDAPELGEIISIERTLAAGGDPITAWRLARRYEHGDGVSASKGEQARWLAIAAGAPVETFPKAKEATLRLCELYAFDADMDDNNAAAQNWCTKAADDGSPAATVYMRRLSSLR